MVTLATQNQTGPEQQAGREDKGLNNSRVDPWVDHDVDLELEAEEASFKPLTRTEAERIRAANPPVSMWRVLGFQMVTGVAVAFLARLVTGQDAMGWSALYGGLAVWIPAALFARGLQRQKKNGDAGSALFGFFVWELVKIALTVAMLLAAPRLLSELNWLALLAGFVVTMKVYWVVMWLHLVRTNVVNKAAHKAVPKNG